MNQETTKGIFNKLAGSYDTPERQVIAGIIHEELARRVEDIPHEAVLLDYGCGTGLMSLPFANHFSKLLLVDIAEEMVEQVEKKCKDLGLSNVKAQSLDVFQAG